MAFYGRVNIQHKLSFVRLGKGVSKAEQGRSYLVGTTDCVLVLFLR